jgi:hypothetical protein
MIELCTSEHSLQRKAKRGLGLAAAVTVAAMFAAPSGAFASTKTVPKGKKVAPKAAAKAAPKAAIFKSDLPSVTVLDLSNSKQVDLASFADGKRPSLIWFWAPH